MKMVNLLEAFVLPLLLSIAFAYPHSNCDGNNAATCASKTNSQRQNSNSSPRQDRNQNRDNSKVRTQATPTGRSNQPQPSTRGQSQIKTKGVDPNPPLNKKEPCCPFGATCIATIGSCGPATTKQKVLASPRPGSRRRDDSRPVREAPLSWEDYVRQITRKAPYYGPSYDILFDAQTNSDRVRPSLGLGQNTGVLTSDPSI